MKVFMKGNFLSTALLALLIGFSTPSNAGTTTYKYDAIGRVIQVNYPDGSIIYYSYDAAGNRTQTTRQAGS